MKPSELTEAENLKLTEDSVCPDCGARLLIFGPRGGLTRNVICAGCRTEFNASLISSERIGQPCDTERAKRVYNLDEDDHAIKSFTLNKPLTRAMLDENTCENPECKNPTHHELVLNSVCHNRGGIIVKYNRDDGVLYLHCNVCNRPVVKIQVA